MTQMPVFRGTEEEAKALKDAIDHNCQCHSMSAGMCEPHALLKDARVLSHLLYGRRCSAMFECEEWDTEGGT
jgi:hypothetical protein